MSKDKNFKDSLKAVDKIEPEFEEFIGVAMERTDLLKPYYSEDVITQVKENDPVLIYLDIMETTIKDTKKAIYGI